MRRPSPNDMVCGAIIRLEPRDQSKEINPTGLLYRRDLSCFVCIQPQRAEGEVSNDHGHAIALRDRQAIDRHRSMGSKVHGQAWKRREHGSESRASMVRGARGMRGGDSCGHGGKCTYERAKTVKHRSVTRREGRRAGYTWSTLVRIEPETPHRCSCARV